MLEDPYNPTVFHAENIFSGDTAIVFVSFNHKAVVVGAGYNGNERTTLTPDTAEAFANSILEHVEYVRERNKPKLPVTPESLIKVASVGYNHCLILDDAGYWRDCNGDLWNSPADMHWTLIYDAGADNA